MDNPQTALTLPELLKQRVDRTPDQPAFWTRSSKRRWSAITWQQFRQKALQVTYRLQATGLKPGEAIAILAKNSIDWEVVQHGAMAAGAVVIGLDLNDPPARLQRIVQSSSVQALFVDDEALLDRFLVSFCSSLKLVAVRLFPVTCLGKPITSVLADLTLTAKPKALPSLTSDDPATIIFTSGTTGEPKSMVFSHGQVLLAIEAILSRFQTIPPQAHLACWLPLSNPFQRIINFCAIRLNLQSFMVENPAEIMAQVREINPFLFAAVPRFYEKAYEAIQEKIQHAPIFLRPLIRWAEQVGGRYWQVQRQGKAMDWGLRLQYQLAHCLVLKQFQKALGNIIRLLLSGSAPMPVWLLEKFHGLGWLILECYGISENIIPIALNTPEQFRFGSVGKPLAANTIRFAAEGEIAVKSKGISASVKPDPATGFLSTGDLGKLDADGFLWLEGRQADVFKLSTGRKVVPLRVEEILKGLDFVEHAVVFGKNQKVASAILAVHAEKWQLYLNRFDCETKALAQLKQTVQAAAGDLPSYFLPVEYCIVTTPFSVTGGELTTNLKVRRNVVLEKYGDATRLENHPNC